MHPGGVLSYTNVTVCHTAWSHQNNTHTHKIPQRYRGMIGHTRRIQYQSYCNRSKKLLTSLYCYLCYCDRIHTARIRLVGILYARLMKCAAINPSDLAQLADGRQVGELWFALAWCVCVDAMRTTSDRRTAKLFAHSISRFSDRMCQVVSLVYRIPTGSPNWQCTLKWKSVRVFLVVPRKFHVNWMYQ